MRTSLCVLVFALAACGPRPDLELRRLEPKASAIVNGTEDSGDPEIFMLEMTYPGAGQAGCTATLIGQRTLLTAAHCVDPTLGGTTTMSIRATNASQSWTAGDSDMIEVTETLPHPSWDARSLANDIALALLKRPPGVTPKQWNRASVDAFAGRPLRAAGYGTTGASGYGSGQKRTVTVEFGSITTRLINVGDGTHGICHGDSGGPSMHTFSDGVERVVGVHSFTRTDLCTDGADTRVDYYADFITDWLRQKDVAQCTTDGLCKAGCVPIDVDCLCQEDALCNPECPNLLDDPDCPVDCVENEICSVDACPVPDRDCVEVGAKCTDAKQCRARLCTSDAQHDEAYCSQDCESAKDCPSGMECSEDGECIMHQLPVMAMGEACADGKNLCETGTVCRISGKSGVCSQPCSGDFDCAKGWECGEGSTARYCEKKPEAPVSPTSTSKYGEEEQQKQGCSSVPGHGVATAWPLLLLSMALLGRRRSRT